jgi:hypothetical protein
VKRNKNSKMSDPKRKVNSFAEIYRNSPPPRKQFPRKITKPLTSEILLDKYIVHVFMKPVGKSTDLVHPNCPFAFKEEEYWD